MRKPKSSRGLAMAAKTAKSTSSSARLYKSLDRRIFKCEEAAGKLIREPHWISGQLDWEPEELAGEDSIPGMKIEKARYLFQRAGELLASAGSSVDQKETWARERERRNP